jgi:hypothetical protein
MHRPTRKHTHLTKKLASKQAQSRGSGKKARRWKKALEQYKTLSQAQE